ncbi:MAG: hypothetical protein P9L97_06815 [Candidatus Tenebribacter davisii]|nr:hypothetical protein [Candidatus Tenebribacter davisii]
MKKIILFLILIPMFSILLSYENTLEVRTDVSGVKVYIDGSYIGCSEPFGEFNVFRANSILPGSHLLKCIYIDFEPFIATINIPIEGTLNQEVFFNIEDVNVADITYEEQEKKLNKTGSITVSAYDINKKREVEGIKINIDNNDSKKLTKSKLELLVGDYTISLQHDNYPEVSQTISINENQNVNTTFFIESNSWNRNKEKKWKKQIWIGLTASAFFAGGGFYCNMQMNNKNDEYKNADVTNDVMSLKQKTQDFENYRDYCYYTASGVAIYSVFSWIKTAYYHGKL